eukprot:Gb_11982 [translate_table: standard]
MLGAASFPTIIQFVLILFLPESPLWLFQKNKQVEAVATLKKIYEPDRLKIEIGNLSTVIEEEFQEKSSKEKIGLFGVFVSLAILSGAFFWTSVNVLTIDIYQTPEKPASGNQMLPETWFVTNPTPGKYCHQAFFSPGMGPVLWALNSEIYPLKYKGLSYEEVKNLWQGRTKGQSKGQKKVSYKKSLLHKETKAGTDRSNVSSLIEKYLERLEQLKGHLTRHPNGNGGEIEVEEDGDLIEEGSELDNEDITTLEKKNKLLEEDEDEKR